MVEVDVSQGSEEWFELRQCVVITASRFGEALGCGKGKPFHFLSSLLSETDDRDPQSQVHLLRYTLRRVVIDHIA